MNSVFLLKAKPVDDSHEEILLAIYATSEMANRELEQYKECGLWKDLKIEMWEVRKEYDWTPTPSPYSTPSMPMWEL